MPALTTLVQVPDLRKHPHRLGQMYLYVFQPETVFAAEVNSIPPVPGYDIQNIPFWNVTSGAITNVRRGHTLWIGSALGLKDGGIVRIREDGAPGDTAINVSEHEIYLSAAPPPIYLTVKDEFCLWHVSPFITNAGAIYKDCDDITAPAQVAFPGPGPGAAGVDRIYQPVPVMGPHSIQWLGEDHYFDWSRCWAVAPGAAIAGYNATFPGGNPPNSVAPSGTVSWATPGARWVDLIVTDSNGVASYAGHRLFVTLNPDWRDENGLYASFTPSPRQGDIGFSMGFTIHVEASEDDFPDGALVIWFFDGGTQEDISGNWPYRSHIHFIGYVKRGTTHKEPETGHVTFEAETIQASMQSLPTFPNFYEINAAPTVWTQAHSLTVQRAATLHMRWQSTLLEVADVLFVPAATTSIGEHEFPEGDLYSQLNSLVNRDYLYRIGCDPLGTIYFNKDPQFLPRPGAWLPPAGIDTIMTIQPQDWQGAIDLPEPLLPETAHVLGSGIAYAAGVSTPLFSHAPGPVPLESGKKDTSLSRLILTSQANLNILTGLVLAQANDNFPDVPVPLAGQYYIGHLFPMEFVGLDIYGTAIPYGTKRDVDLSGEKFIPRRSQLEVVYDKDGAPSHAMVSLNLEKLTYGPAGRTLLYPTSTSGLTVPGPDEGPSGGGWLPPAPPVPGSGGGMSVAYLALDNGHVIRGTAVFGGDPGAVVYEDLGLVDAGGLYWIALDEFDRENKAMVCGSNGIWYTTNLADAIPVWNHVYTPPNIPDEIICQVKSSPVTEHWWLACGLDGLDIGVPVVYWTFNTVAWNRDNTIEPVAGHNGWAKCEPSYHDRLTAWVTWYRPTPGTNYQAVVCKTTTIWGASNCLTLPVACELRNSWGLNDPVCAPVSHHRNENNASDLIALYGGVVTPGVVDQTQWVLCTNETATCSCDTLCSSEGIATVKWAGCYRDAENKWWLFARCGDGYRFYVSNDGLVWTLQYTWLRAMLPTQRMRHATDILLCAGVFLVTEDGDGVTTGPLWASTDEGLNWQRLTGNWNALCVANGWTGASEPNIYCVAPV